MQLTLIVLAVISFLPRLLFALPTVVLVPGAWHSPAHYFLLQGYLRRAGYPFISKRNPSCDARSPNSQTAALDAQYQRNNVILPLINAGKEVVVVAHSYGGGPGSAAAQGLSVADRKRQNLPGGVVGLILISAIITQDGQSLLNLLPGQVFDKWVLQKVRKTLVVELASRLTSHSFQPNGQLGVAGPKNIFYQNVQNGLSSFAIELIRPQSRASLSTPNGKPAWQDDAFKGRLAYWNSLQDQAIPDIAQKAFLAMSKVTWNVKSAQTDHSSFLSAPRELSSWIDSVVKGWYRLPVNTTFAPLEELGTINLPVIPLDTVETSR